MTEADIRKAIRSAAEARNCKYRITRYGEVHFYGTKPNTNQTGWYLEAQDARAYAAKIIVG
jgi:hypothetical protein